MPPAVTPTKTIVGILALIATAGLTQVYPFNKLWDEPPITGPRAGVDTTRYVAHFRQIAMRLAVDQPDSSRPAIAFNDWTKARQDSFVNERWRQWIFGQFPGDSADPPPDTTYVPPDSGGVPPDTTGAPADSTLPAESDFSYLGAQRISGPVASGGIDGEGGGAALGFYPPNGSLFISGTELTGKVLEISPVSPSLSRNAASLPMTVTLATLGDPTGGLWRVAGDYSRSGDLHPIQLSDGTWRVVFTYFDYYDRSYKSKAGTGWFKPDGTGAQGLWNLGNHPPGQSSSDGMLYQGKLTDYVITVPKAFADAHLGGDRHLFGRERGEYGEDVSCGPPFTRVKLPGPAGAPAGTVLAAVPLISYPTTGFVGENTIPPRALPGYELVDQGTDAVVIDGGIAVIRRVCKYTGHYFDDPPPGSPGNYNTDGGVCDENKGYVCGSEGDPKPGYEVEVLMYSLAELARCARGDINPWEARPYARFIISDNFLNASCEVAGAGAAYDEGARILYVVERKGDVSDPGNPKPVLHSWSIAR